MRKLPVYVVVDVSHSMQGAPINAVMEGFATLCSSLRRDPCALEVAAVSVITFSTEAEQIVPLTEIFDFVPPKLVAKGWSYLDKALFLVRKRAEVEVKRTTAEVKGDWKPLVFIMTDGRPTKPLDESLQYFKGYHWGTVVACAAGPRGDVKTLSRITENVVRLSTITPESIAAFFQWVSSSVSTSSQLVTNAPSGGASFGSLPPPPPELSFVIP